MEANEQLGVETLPPDDIDDVFVPGLPSAWDRYEILELLGRGGMGAIHKARDRRLDRIVAIKFIRGAGPKLTLRLLREARAQARVDHPNVCRVYEVGEIEGRAYIALQLVTGEPLHKAAVHMSLDHKVAVMRDVALAIQEAHRLGIVHRDLKPANIAVDRTPDGQWFPIVMDFGLAHEATVEVGITESGAVLGTPAYMSPEQARGDVHAVDRRSDIYSLGATLYELLTGRPPFVATSLAAALAQILLDDPPAPRSLVPSLPVDLETIALKCLAKDPAQRYGSARSLADDLEHYLAGEPILGRRPSLWQRVRRRARRQRALFVLGASSLVVIAVVAAFGIRAQLISRSERGRAVERTQLAGQLGRDTAKIEQALREAYLVPLHDVSRQRERAEAGMRTIAATRHDLGELGDALIHNALGRGHLALHHWREAADELERAVSGGLETPELHAARGRALGELYRRSLEEVRRSGEKTWLTAQKQELERKYLAPALDELERSAGSGNGATLLESQIALYRREFAAAEKLALDAGKDEPSLFEAYKLAADAAYGAAVEQFDRGEYDAALPELARATAQYELASEIARSDASIYEAAARAWLQRAEIDFRQGGSPREALEHAKAAIERALTADPHDAPAYTTKAYVLLRWYRTPSLDSGDPRPLLEAIAAAAETATENDANDATAWDALGNAHVYRGSYESQHGGLGTPLWKQALGEFDKALKIRPDDPWANNDIGIAHRWLGAELEDQGKDPIPEYHEALSFYQRAIASDPQYLYACIDQADLHVTIAQHQTASGADPRAELDIARRTGNSCLGIDPSFYSTFNTLALAELTLANHLVDTGEDPSEAVKRAREYLDRADQLRPDNIATWFYRAVVARAEAKFQHGRSTDPMSSVATGRAALGEVQRLSPDHADSYVEAARLDLIEAAWLARAGRATALILARALDHAKKALELDPRSADAELTAAVVCLQIAKTQRSAAVANKGLDHVRKALELNPRLREVEDVLIELSRERVP